MNFCRSASQPSLHFSFIRRTLKNAGIQYSPTSRFSNIIGQGVRPGVTTLKFWQSGLGPTPLEGRTCFWATAIPMHFFRGYEICAALLLLGWNMPVLKRNVPGMVVKSLHFVDRFWVTFQASVNIYYYKINFSDHLFSSRSPLLSFTASSLSHTQHHFVRRTNHGSGVNREKKYQASSTLRVEVCQATHLNYLNNP